MIPANNPDETLHTEGTLIDSSYPSLTGLARSVTHGPKKVKSLNSSMQKEPPGKFEENI